MAKNLPVALIILDGWGASDAKEGNAIAQANTPNWDQLIANHPNINISACGQDVGLPEGQMGNSEVGHLTMGAGRIRMQDLARINHAIEDKSFDNNKGFIDVIKYAEQNKCALHILGLLSDGGVHSHEKHIHAFAKLTQKFALKDVYMHAFLDGRDTLPQCADKSLQLFEQQFANTNVKLATISGRFYAMDRDHRWDRIERAFNALYNQAQLHAPNAREGLQAAYERGETDEFVQPTQVAPDYPGIGKNDVIVFMNFRADRARQLSKALISDDFEHFNRNHWHKPEHMLTLTEYTPELPVQVAFEPVKLRHVLGQIIAENKLKQLRLAETEKYAHVTYFFNGGINEPFPLETRKLIPSPKVATYDLQPDMSAIEITDYFVQSLKNKQYDVIICNFANADMVGHTGNFEATVKAIETLDACLGKMMTTLQSVNGSALITADHGNADCMYQEGSTKPHTAHSTNLVPLVYFGKEKLQFNADSGALYDVAPTLLRIMNIEPPKEMTGQSLLE